MVHLQLTIFLISFLTGFFVFILYFNYYLNHKSLMLNYFLFASASMAVLMLMYIICGYFDAYVYKTGFYYTFILSVFYLEYSMYYYYITMFVRMLLCLETPDALKLVFKIIALCPVLMLILPFIILRDMKQVFSVLSWDINNVLSSVLGVFLIYYFVLGCIQFRKIMDFRIKRLLLAVLTLYIVFFPFLFYENVVMRIYIEKYYSSFFWNSFTALFNFMWNALALIIYFRYKPFAPIGNNTVKRVSIPDISERENEIAGMLLQGMSYSSIAGKLFISNETVKTHVRNIYRKLNINSKLGLLSFQPGQRLKSF